MTGPTQLGPAQPRPPAPNRFNLYVTPQGEQDQATRNAAEITAQKAKESTQKKFGRQPAAAPDGQQFTTADAIEMFREAGADVNDPALRSLLSDPATLAWLQDPNIGPSLVQSLVQQYAKPLTPYEQLVQQAGFGYQPPPPALSEGVQVHNLQETAKRGYTTSTSTGAIQFDNGVIVDTDGNVFYPPDKAVEGSASWRRQIQSTWSDADVKTWRKKLVNMGYLPQGAQKQNGFDQALLDALSSYYNARYANGGKEVARDLMGAGGQPLVDMSLFRPEIENEVRATFQDVFNDDPTSNELKRWTDMVIGSASKYQKKGLSASEAKSQAINSAVSGIYGSPEGQYYQDTQQENTSLHDALVNAARATSAVMR